MSLLSYLLKESSINFTNTLNESFLDDLHTIRFQTQRYDIPRKSKNEILLEEIERYNKMKDKGNQWGYFIKYYDLEMNTINTYVKFLDFVS